MSTIYGLIDEGKCPVLWYLDNRIAALTDKPFVYFLTSRHWGMLVKEIKEGQGVDIGRKDLIIRHVTFSNAGTDDLAAVHEANVQSAMMNNFADKKDALRGG